MLRVQALNNEVEYKAFLVGLKLTTELKVSNLEIYSDSELVVYQVRKTYQAKGENMVAYLKKAKDLSRSFSMYLIKVIPRARNAHVDALAKLTSTRDVELLNVVTVEFLPKPKITT